MNYQGMLIHRKRLERGWSQEGLCKGICAVSYLSKIEQGKATPSEEVLQLLMERLGLHVDEQISAGAKALSEEAYELLFAGELDVVRTRLAKLKDVKSEEYGMLLLECFEECRKKLPIGYASFHMPWVLEWYTASRQYKKAYELIADFPVKHSLKCF